MLMNKILGYLQMTISCTLYVNYATRCTVIIYSTLQVATGNLNSSQNVADLK